LAKNPEFDFAPSFYLVAIPVMNLLVVPFLAILGVEGFGMPTDWIQFLRNVVIVLLGSLISVGTYTVAIQPLKDYARTQKALKGVG
jgi:hypothetical protein